MLGERLKAGMNLPSSCLEEGPSPTLLNVGNKFSRMRPLLNLDLILDGKSRRTDSLEDNLGNGIGSILADRRQKGWSTLFWSYTFSFLWMA